MTDDNHSIPSFQESLNRFITYFSKDLTEYLVSGKTNAKFRSVVVGGYGLKLLLEHKHKSPNAIKSKDLDITLSSYKSRFTDEEILTYIVDKLVKFIRLQPNSRDYKVTIIQAPQYVPVLDYTRKALVMVSYRYNEFVDIAITNAKVTKKMIDQQTSLACGLPLKNVNEYLLELLSIIYRSNVIDVSPEVYEKRNPVDGYNPEKGIQDIQRAKLVCDVSKVKTYKTYCDFIKTVSIKKLLSTTAQERSKYFTALQGLLSLKKKIIKKSLTVDKQMLKTVVI